VSSSALPFALGFELMSSPAEARFAAYSITAEGPAADPGAPGTVCSGALLRAILVNVQDDGGPLELHVARRSVRYRYRDVLDVFTATPFPNPRYPVCAVCGQWESEHRNPNASACGAFTAVPAPGTAGNALCRLCEQPYLHHGRRFTVACKTFR
jgi:hypothetical protein